MSVDPNAWMAGAGTASTAIGAGKRAARGTAVDAGHVPGVKYDSHKRYLLPDPATGEERGWTRVTTLLGCLGSGHGLGTWTERGIIEGLALRPDLRSLLASAPGDKEIADEVLAAAKEASGLHAARRHGSAVHGALERSLLGQPLALDADEPVARDVAAIMLLLEGEGLHVVRVERVVLHATLGYAGRLDLVVEVTLPDGRTVHRVVDVKTGKDAGRGARARKTQAQLAAYARSTHLRRDDGSLVDTQREIPLDLEVGCVIAVRDGAAELLEADLGAGWTDVLLASKEHQRRKAASDMLPVGKRYLAPEPQIVADLRAAVTEATEAAPLAAVAPSLPAPKVGEIMRAEAFSAAFVAASTGANVPPTPVAEEKTATGRAKPKCSRCRQPGHRAKTCTATLDEPATAADESSSSAWSTPGICMECETAPANPGSTVCDPCAENIVAAARAHAPTSIEEVVSGGGTCDCSAPQWSVPEWSARPDVTVCASCGWPSSATLTRLLGERSGLASVTGSEGTAVAAPLAAQQDDVEFSLREARSNAEIDRIKGRAIECAAWTDRHAALAAMLRATLAERPRDLTTEPYCKRCDYNEHLCPGCGADLEHGVEVCERCRIEHATDDVTAQIKAAVSQAELSTVWQAAMAAGTWTSAHTALATERAPGLPPTSDLPF